MSNTITTQDVETIAKLSRMQLSSEEVEAATQQLQGILGNFSAIQSIDTKDTPTSDDITGLKNVVRQDTPEENTLCSKQALLDRAPQVQDDQIKVKAVF